MASKDNTCIRIGHWRRAFLIWLELGGFARAKKEYIRRGSDILTNTQKKNQGRHGKLALGRRVMSMGCLLFFLSRSGPNIGRSCCYHLVLPGRLLWTIVDTLGFSFSTSTGLTWSSESFVSSFFTQFPLKLMISSCPGGLRIGVILYSFAMLKGGRHWMGHGIVLAQSVWYSS